MNWIFVLIFLASLAAFLGFSWIAIKHAARFRYLSSRTVYLTIFYVAASSILLVLSLVTFIGVIAS